MFSAVRKANLKPGEWLLLPGAGGGLGHLFVICSLAYTVPHRRSPAVY